MKKFSLDSRKKDLLQFWTKGRTGKSWESSEGEEDTAMKRWYREFVVEEKRNSVSTIRQLLTARIQWRDVFENEATSREWVVLCSKHLRAVPWNAIVYRGTYNKAGHCCFQVPVQSELYPFSFLRRKGTSSHWFPGKKEGINIRNSYKKLCPNFVFVRDKAIRPKRYGKS